MQYEFETDTPVAGTDARIARIVEHVRRGYVVESITGNASPEGPEQRRRPRGFMGNISLAELRATTADRLVREATAHAVTPSPLSMRALTRRERASLRRASTGQPTVSGGSELFGRSAAGEVSRARLPRHLERELAAPGPGQTDPLATAGVIGAPLPSDIDETNQVAVDRFRRGRELGLSTQERIDALYPLFRRALVILRYRPVTPTPEELVGDRAAQRIECTGEHMSVFAGVPFQFSTPLSDNCVEGQTRQ